jgi:hydroxymethylpyrimidine/phosphomethylpyrimidine kinase
MIPRILIIAGSDSSGGAGIGADIKTVTMLGGFAMTAITAITAQNTLGVDAVMPVPTDMVLRQIDAVVNDIGVDAIKIGMIGSSETAEAVAERLGRLGRLGRFGGAPIVFDPIMVATSGAALADAPTIAAFERLMQAARLVTPNIPELEVLTGRMIGNIEEMQAAALALADRTGAAVLAKGGHMPGNHLTDLLVEDGKVHIWESERIETRHTHGTGCTLASAIACGLVGWPVGGSGQNIALVDAIGRARDYVRAAMLAAPGFGGGHGPLGVSFEDIHRKKR